MAEISTILSDPWADVVGQAEACVRLEQAAAEPVHAYLFLGSRGSGSFPAALGFAALVLSADLAAVGGADEDAGVDEGSAPRRRAITLAKAGKHPDVVVIEPEGAAIRVSEAEEIIRAGLRTPVEGRRKVIVVTGAEAMEEAAVGKLLKVIEEPPSSAVFVLLAEELPPEIVTIASRCVIIEFGPLSVTELEQALVADGVDLERAVVAASAAGGDVDRARLLATDEALADRAEAWRRIPDELDGSGRAVTAAVDRVRTGMDGAQGPLEARQQVELEQLEARVEQLGERGSGRAELVAKHKREIRRLRSDELRFGLATLSRVYRDRLVEAESERDRQAVAAIQAAAENLIRNPNEALLLQDLFCRLSPASATASG